MLFSFPFIVLHFPTLCFPCTFLQTLSYIYIFFYIFTQFAFIYIFLHTGTFSFIFIHFAFPFIIYIRISFSSSSHVLLFRTFSIYIFFLRFHLISVHLLHSHTFSFLVIWLSLYTHFFFLSPFRISSSSSSVCLPYYLRTSCFMLIFL